MLFDVKERRLKLSCAGHGSLLISLDMLEVMEAPNFAITNYLVFSFICCAGGICEK